MLGKGGPTLVVVDHDHGDLQATLDHLNHAQRRFHFETRERFMAATGPAEDPDAAFVQRLDARKGIAVQSAGAAATTPAPKRAITLSFPDGNGGQMTPSGDGFARAMEFLASDTGMLPRATKSGLARGYAGFTFSGERMEIVHELKAESRLPLLAALGQGRRDSASQG